MRAAVFTAVDAPLVLEDLSEPALGPGDVRVKVDASGVCHSDLTVANGGIPYPPPVILGHEGAGTVLETGSAVRGIKAGDRVITTFTPVCGRCWHCLRDETHLCTSMRPMFTPRAHRGDGSAIIGMAGLGTFADVMTLPQESVVRVRSDLPAEQLALLGCGASTGIGAALNTAQVVPGSTVAVIGCGGVGLFVIMGAVLAGAGRVIAIDPLESKRSAALGLGATDVVDPGTGDTAGQVRELTDGRGADYTFEVVGLAETIQTALEATRRGGTAVMAGMPRAGSTVTLPAFDLFSSDKRILGCTYGSTRVRRDFQRWIDLAEAGRIELGQVISRRYGFEDVNVAMDDLRAGQVLRAMLL